MSSRAFLDQKHFTLYLSSTYESLLTSLIRKSIVQELKLLGFDFQEFSIVFQEVTQTPAELKDHEEQLLAKEQEIKDKQQPLAQWLLSFSEYQLS